MSVEHQSQLVILNANISWTAVSNQIPFSDCYIRPEKFRKLYYRSRLNRIILSVIAFFSFSARAKKIQRGYSTTIFKMTTIVYGEVHLLQVSSPSCRHRGNRYKLYGKLVCSISSEVNPLLPNVPFWSPWKHQKTKGFLMFSGGSKGNIGK